MEDDYQVTLKGKIKILFQLEKWQDVIKLSEQFNEKYGKDVEIDMMRFKSERRLSKSAADMGNKERISKPDSQAHEKPESSAIPDSEDEEVPLLLLTAEPDEMQNPAMLILNEISTVEEPRLVEDKLVDEPFELVITDPFAEDKPAISQISNEPSPGADELLITDPFAEDKPAINQISNEPSPDVNELLITDPFAESEPVFKLANNEPPVILIDKAEAEAVPMKIEPEKEGIAFLEEIPSELADSKITFDFKSNAAGTFDAEPALTSESQEEPEAMQINAEEKKLSAESAAYSSVLKDKSSEILHEISASTGKAEPVEKPKPFSGPYENNLKRTKSPRKIAFNFKYVLVLVLPLFAAVFLWLALSGKLHFNRSVTEKPSPVSAVEPPLPAVQKPAPKVTPTAVIPQIDEKEKLVNERINQANDFLKKGDMLNALTVVLEAKKIKITEPLRLLEELITKKIREDESLAAEQKQTDQSVLKSEDQAYATAEAENTLTAWQNFILLYPQGEFVARARNKIVVLQKKAAQKAEQEFRLKIQQMQKLKLRSEYLELNQAELTAVLRRLGKPISQFERLEHGGEEVIVDFFSGLMWTLWNKPMNFDKAKWWANRIYAGYSGWRLPTVEESLSLLQMDPSHYSGIVDFAVWTGDGVSDKSHSVWALRIPQGNFIPEDYGQIYYVWAVRKVGK